MKLALVLAVVAVAFAAALPPAALTGPTNTPAPKGGKLLAYDYAPIPNTGIGHTIYLAAERGGTPRRLAHASGQTPSFSRDGRWVAFSNDQVPGACQNCDEIQVAAVNGGTVTTLTTSGSSGNAALSPDGKLIAYDHVENIISGPDHVYVVLRSGGTPRLLAPSLSGVATPVWFPDGKRILLRGDKGLYSVGADGRGLKLLVRGNADFPAFSPDGTRILFTRTLPGPNRTVRSETMIVTANGTHLHRLGDAKLQRFEASWSPNAKQVVFAGSALPTATTLPSGSSLYLINADGTQQRLLLGAAGIYLHNPVFSPDGKWVAFTEPHGTGQFAADNDDVILVPAAGGRERVVSGRFYAWPGSYLVWQP